VEENEGVTLDKENPKENKFEEPHIMENEGLETYILIDEYIEIKEIIEEDAKFILEEISEMVNEEEKEIKVKENFMHESDKNPFQKEPKEVFEQEEPHLLDIINIGNFDIPCKSTRR